MSGHFDDDWGTPRKREGPGGFLATADVESPTKRMHAAISTLKPVTIRQLHRATQVNERTFEIDGSEIQKCIVVARLGSINKQSSELVYYVIEDGTDQIDAVKWEESDSESVEFREGDWLRIIGSLKSFAEKRNFNVLSMTRIHDFNHLVYHMACVIECHYYTRGMLDLEIDEGLHEKSPFIAPESGAGNHLLFGLSKNQKLVLDVFGKCKAKEGEDIRNVCRQLESVLSEGEVRSIVETLIDDGHLYSTIDNNHARITSI